MNEITVDVKQKSGMISIENFDEVKEYLEEKMKEYQGLQFTEESKADAKRTVAALRKLKADLSGRVKEVKKDYLIPFQQFEERVEELYGLIDKPISEINKQVEEFEEKRLKEKKELITDLYQEHVASVDSVAKMIPLERIYNQKWENTTTTKKAIVTEMKEWVSTIENDLSVIRSFQSVYELRAVEKYRTTLRLSDAINLIQTLERQDREIRERIEKEEAQHKAKEQKDKQVPQPDPAKEETEPEKPEQRKPSDLPKTEKIKMVDLEILPVDYKIYADPFQCAQIDAFLRQNGIRFEKGGANGR